MKTDDSEGDILGARKPTSVKDKYKCLFPVSVQVETEIYFI